MFLQLFNQKSKRGKIALFYRPHVLEVKAGVVRKPRFGAERTCRVGVGRFEIARFGDCKVLYVLAVNHTDRIKFAVERKSVLRRVPTLGYGRIVFHTAEAETEEERVCIVVFKLTRLVVGDVVNRDIYKREARGDCLLRVSARNAGSIKSDIIRISIDGYVNRTRRVAIVDCADARRGRARLRFPLKLLPTIPPIATMLADLLRITCKSEST